MLLLSPGCFSTTQDEISATSTSHCTAALLETAASGAMPRHAAAGTSRVHSSEEISIYYPLAGCNCDREAEASAQQIIKKIEDELTELTKSQA